MVSGEWYDIGYFPVQSRLPLLQIAFFLRTDRTIFQRFSLLPVSSKTSHKFVGWILHYENGTKIEPKITGAEAQHVDTALDRDVGMAFGQS